MRRQLQKLEVQIGGVLASRFTRKPSNESSAFVIRRPARRCHHSGGWLRPGTAARRRAVHSSHFGIERKLVPCTLERHRIISDDVLPTSFIQEMPRLKQHGPDKVQGQLGVGVWVIQMQCRGRLGTYIYIYDKWWERRGKVGQVQAGDTLFTRSQDALRTLNDLGHQPWSVSIKYMGSSVNSAALVRFCRTGISIPLNYKPLVCSQMESRELRCVSRGGENLAANAHCCS